MVVEPVVGREGVVFPPPGWLSALAEALVGLVGDIDRRVALGGVGRTLFVLDPDTANAKITQHIEDFQVGATGIAKHHVNAFQLQAPGQDLGAFEGAFTLLLLDVRQLAAGDGGDVLVGYVIN